MTRNELAIHWQEQAAERYEFARWEMGKASKQRALLEAGASNIYYVRRNACVGDMTAAAAMSQTARILMGVEE